MASLAKRFSGFYSKLSSFNASSCVRYQSSLSQKLVYSEYGEPAKVICVEEEKLNEPKPTEVIVRMLAASVNPADINTIQGVYPVKPKLPAIGGNEGVGEIAWVGSEVTCLKKGDRVIPNFSGWGTWRTVAVCKPTELLKISDKVGIVEAATITVNPCTAYRMLKDFVNLKPGDTVIQNGANSAAGQNVIQLCKAWGINSVNIVRNRENIDELKCFLKDLGATHVLTEEELRKTEIFKKSELPRPQLALNCVGGKNALEVLRHVGPKGFMVTYGGMSREPVTVPTSALIFKDVSIRGYWMTRWGKENEDKPERMEMFNDLIDLIVNGKLKAPIHKLVPFTDFKEALLNTMTTQGFAGMKYVLDFKNSCGDLG